MAPRQALNTTHTAAGINPNNRPAGSVGEREDPVRELELADQEGLAEIEDRSWEIETGR
jgi:hypothetical protein